MQHVRNVATSTTTKVLMSNKSFEATSTTDYSNSILSNENGFSVELPKPLLMLANRKPTANSMEAKAMSKRQHRAFSHRPTLMDVVLQASAREGLHAMTELYGKLVPNIVRNGHLLEDNHPAALLSKFSESTSETLQQEMAAYATISATKAFRKNYKYFNELARQAHTSKISLRHTALEGLCPPRDPPTCMPASARYRTHDGTCNSRRRPRWGAGQMPFNRFLPPEYGDGVDSVRMSVDGGPLASSRFVSLLVHGARDGEAAVTLMTAQWGQLLDHDMTSTAQPRSINGSVPSCCGKTDFHPSCFPIKVPLDDPWLSPLKVRCLEFLRSAPAQRRDCILSWREQTNQATSYIDASPIYSNSVKSSDNARVFRNGLLVFGRGNPTEDACQRGAIATHCIRAGDGRSGEQPGLLALHHVWVGEHNRIAMELSQMNLHWSDEKIYQEARRIVGAMFQHITYREFLPIVLGREVCKLFDLELMSSGYYEGYDPKTNPTVANSFAAAAFRFGHSLVQNSYMRCDRFHNFMRNNVSLHEEFQRGDIGSPGSLHRLLRGLVNQRALKRDEFITPELTNHLFQTPGFPFGLDLAAINIQRGRDHGVPPYTAWRVPCGLTPINSWEEFANVVGPQSAHRISHAYRSVHDIDLFVGGIAERPVVGGLVGPTFACIIAQQFSNSRKGDRFWYENGGFENSFTPAQLNSIRSVSLAQILCRAVGGGTMQPHAFLPTELEGNERQVCGIGALTPFDLSPWIEHDPFTNTLTTPTQEPDRVFDIIVTDDVKETATTGTVQVVKENKVGFPNRLRPTDHKNTAIAGNNAFVQGIQVPGEIIRINDKLDIRQKVTPVKRPTVTAKPIKGINNKLDKGPPKLTLNIRGVTIRRPQGTRRTTVVVNNIPVELRSAMADETEHSKRTKTNGTKSHLNSTTRIQNATENTTVDRKEARIDDTDQEVELVPNELTNSGKRTELMKQTEFDQTLEDSEKESNTIHKRATANEQNGTKEQNNSTKEDNYKHIRMTANEQIRTNAEIRITDQNSSATDDNTTHRRMTSNETIGIENAEMRTTGRHISATDDNTTHRRMTTNETIGINNAEMRTTDRNSSATDDNTIHRRMTTNETIGINNAEIRTKKISSTKEDHLRATTKEQTETNDLPIRTKEQNNSSAEFNIKNDIAEQSKIEGNQIHEELKKNIENIFTTTRTELNAKESGGELIRRADNETVTTKLEEPKINEDETRTDEELTVNSKNPATMKTKKDELRTDVDENAIRNDSELTTNLNDKVDTAIRVVSETSTLNNQTALYIKRYQTKENSERDTEINTEDFADTFLNSKSKSHKTGNTDKVDDKRINVSSRTTFDTEQSAEDTHSNSKLNKSEHFGKLDSTTESKQIITTFATQQAAADIFSNSTTNKSATIGKVYGKTENKARLTTFETQQTTADINPLTQAETIEEQKRLKRGRTDDTLKLIVIKGVNSENETKVRLHAKTTKTASSSRISTTDAPLKNPSTRSSYRQELRQYQTQPTFYTRPQKVVINGPNSDQYEIEINIRQTNQKQSPSAPAVSAATNPYTNYPTTHKPYNGYDRYSTNYLGTYYANNKGTVTANTLQTRRTRPPTIIYVNEYDDRYTSSTTTRTPGLFQNILTYATSGLGNFNKQQQQASPHSTTNIQKEHPIYGAAGTLSNTNGINQIYSPNAGVSSISHYIPRPGTQTQALPAHPAVPSAASLSQVGGVVSSSGIGGAGVAHASSSAISTGNFGTITGVAQANGADSTFSFNIRPKPSGVGQSQLPLPINEINGGSYGLLSTQHNTNPSFGNLANSEASLSGHTTHYGNANKQSANSPFSSANNRPQQESYYGYYGHKQKLPLQKKTVLEGISAGPDYDEFEIARTLEPIKTKITTNKATNRDDKDEYSENEDDENESGGDYDYTDDDLSMSEQFDRDGYVRPEHIINTLLKSKENELKNLTCDKNCTTKPLDDNYVLPILNTTTKDELKSKDLKSTEITMTATEKPSTSTITDNVTNFPDIMGKHFNNDILAVDYEDELTETLLSNPASGFNTLTNDETQENKKASKIERTNTESVLTGEIAFAPIKILNKLERPDNWLIYDSPKNYTRLPDLPAMQEEGSSAPTNEIPKPFQGLNSIWLKKIKKDKSRNKEQFLGIQAIALTQNLDKTRDSLSSETSTTTAPANMTLI